MVAGFWCDCRRVAWHLRKMRLMLNKHAQDRHIALTWLARLRWFAVGGQLAATVAAMVSLKLELPIALIGLVIAITVLSNGLIEWQLRRGDVPAVVVPLIIILDVCLLTLLLLCTGGANNPFSILYVVHVAMAVVVLGSAWAWAIVLISAMGYALILKINQPIQPPLSQSTFKLGQWFALILVTGLIAYFTGRVMRSLKRREGELAEMRERAGRSAYLASLTTLAGGAAHELGTPLGTIALVAKELELAASKNGADESIIEDARLIRQECDRCRTILDRMRIDVVEDLNQKPSLAPLSALIEDLTEELKAQEKDRFKVESAVPMTTEIPHMRVLRTAVSVLIRNAFDASPSATPVVLRVSTENNRLHIKVVDSGTGMEDDVLQRAGEPFFTTKPVGKGMGLGLFLVRLVADNFGGKLTLESTQGLGTKSTIELPLNRA